MMCLLCTVAAVLVLSLLGTVVDSAYVCKTPSSPPVSTTPDKCLNKVETGSVMSNEARQSVVNAVNLYRAFITNQCDKFKSGKPKSANFRKIQYSCDLEQQVKFTCPAKTQTFETSGTVFRIIVWGSTAYSIFYRLAPWLEELEINGETQDFVDNTVRFANTVRFYLNGDAVEIGCYVNKCHGLHYLACTTATQIPKSGALYTPGNRCQKNTDCTVPGYHICDMEYGLCDKGGKPPQQCQKDADCTDSDSPICNLDASLCGPLTCKFSESGLTIDACQDLHQCSEATDKANPEKHFCQSTVIIAERNNDHTFTVKGFGAAVGEKHLLTSVSSKFSKCGTTDLYVIVGGTKIYPLRTSSVKPRMRHGSFNINAGQDLLLVKLAAASPFKFDQFLKVKKVSLGVQDKSLTVRLQSDKMAMNSILLQPDDECLKIFSSNSAFPYTQNSNMACGLDENDKATKFLSGAPLCDVPLTDGKHVLHGIRSLSSHDPGHKNGFLVTKLAPNCDWLFQVSEGEVKCI
uniref:ZP domain-containing protein n=1 Tax=Panagrellus redivivus TaxID=6233 RepID=A0A7E4VF85_PANRE